MEIVLPGVFRPRSDTWMLAEAARGEALVERGLLAPDQRDEEVLVLRGRVGEA